jgi:pseudouridine kinase
VTKSSVPIVCIGGAVVDRNLTCTDGFELGVSNPVTSATSFGGVARNVAESLGRLGADVRLVTAVGNDAAGTALLSHIKSAGVDTRHVAVRDDLPTAEYIAAMAGGEMRVAFADMAIFDQLTPDLVQPALADLPSLSMVFADCNLPAETLAMLLEGSSRRQYFLAFDGVSPAKCARLPKRLDALAILFTNSAQLTSMTRLSQVDKSVERMAKRGCTTIIATLGGEGLLLADDDRRALYAAPQVPIVSVSGAGDAIAAGTLFGISQVNELPAAVTCGIALASLVLQTVHAVPQHLSRDVLKAVLAAPASIRKGPKRVH